LSFEAREVVVSDKVHLQHMNTLKRRAMMSCTIITSQILPDNMLWWRKTRLGVKMRRRSGGRFEFRGSRGRSQRRGTPTTHGYSPKKGNDVLYDNNITYAASRSVMA
jgi:hypothetical protein